MWLKMVQYKYWEAVGPHLQESVLLALHCFEKLHCLTIGVICTSRTLRVLHKICLNLRKKWEMLGDVGSIIVQVWQPDHFGERTQQKPLALSEAPRPPERLPSHKVQDCSIDLSLTRQTQNCKPICIKEKKQSLIIICHLTQIRRMSKLRFRKAKSAWAVHFPCLRLFLGLQAPQIRIKRWICCGRPAVGSPPGLPGANLKSTCVRLRANGEWDVKQE